MGKITYSFNPEDRMDIDELFKFLNKLYPDISKHNNLNSSDIRNIQTRESKPFINFNEDNATKENNQIKEVITELNSCKEHIESLNKEVNEKDLKIKDLNDKLSKEQAKANNLILEKEQEIEKLKKEIKELRKKLSEFIPSFCDDQESRKWFMAISSTDNTLEKSLSNDEPFMAVVNPEGNALFAFNTEKGRHNEFSKNPQKLEAFCEIVDKVKEANHIQTVEYGKGHVSSDTLIVDKKAKIKLIRE